MRSQQNAEEKGKESRGSVMSNFKMHHKSIVIKLCGTGEDQTDQLMEKNTVQK
jgi:hypothetical protein